MALTNMPTMDGYILKSAKECTASNKQANSPTNCLPQDYLAKGTTNVPPHQAYGGTNGDQSSLHSSSTILAANTQIVNMPITY